MGEVTTFCRICEAHCGLVATVEAGTVTKLRPDREHPLSQGYACPKGIAFADVQNDPERVVHPLRRRDDGTFERVSWEAAIAEIGTRLRAVRDAHGGEAIGWYMGNPGAFSHSHPVWVKGFLDALGSQHYFTASSQDVANKFAAAAMLYGSAALWPIPDLPRTRFLLAIGANPLVSHGSVLTAPRVKDQLHAIVARGGRVVVVDPRRSETARAFEHVPVAPDADAFLLLGLLHTIFAEGLADEAAIRAQAVGTGWLEQAAARFAPEDVAARTGVPAAQIRQLARDFAAADGAVAYGRTGSCLGRFGTITAHLLEALNLVTGNLDRPGGAVLGMPAIKANEVLEAAGLDSYGRRRSRVGGFPDVLGAMPATLIPQEIETPGDGQLRALFVSAGNPALSCPDGEAFDRALPQLDLLVSLDLYVNETNRHADFVLPATTFLEREDLPLAFLGLYTTPFAQWTDPVVAPRGEAQDEWRTIDALARELGVVPLPGPVRVPRALARFVTPERVMDLLLRTGPERLSVARLRQRPSGVVLGDHVATGVLRRRLRTRDRRVHLDPAPIRAELERLAASEQSTSEDFPLLLTNLRELRSHNSWMHNSALLTRGGRTHSARVHPDDAARAGLADGDPVVLRSPWGAVQTTVKVTDEMRPGAVAVPHGWGHRGGWSTANGLGGANVNRLMPGSPSEVEPLSGMAWLSGVPVRLEPALQAVA
jgi:formate dehydrogenase